MPVKLARKKAPQEWHRGHPVAAKSLVATVASVVVGLPAYFGADSLWETKKEAALHAERDEARSAWTQFGFADIRSQFLDDHVFECNLKRGAGKLTAVETAVCARHDANLVATMQLATELKKEALTIGKGK